MVLWLVAAPIVILLLALAGANWKRFHLAYARHLMSSDDLDKQDKGALMIVDTHLREGMSLEAVRRLLAPAKPLSANVHPKGFRIFYVATRAGGKNPVAFLFFDEKDRLSHRGPLKW